MQVGKNSIMLLKSKFKKNPMFPVLVIPLITQNTWQELHGGQKVDLGLVSGRSQPMAVEKVWTQDRDAEFLHMELNM